MNSFSQCRLRRWLRSSRDPGAIWREYARFSEAGVYGVVESDSFDRVLEVEGDETFIPTPAKRLMHFGWSGVDQDVLKILQENFIG